MKYPPMPSTRSMPPSCQDGDRAGWHHGGPFRADSVYVIEIVIERYLSGPGPVYERGAALMETATQRCWVSGSNAGMT
jgi:hypothetical protein